VYNAIKNFHRVLKNNHDYAKQIHIETAVHTTLNMSVCS